MSELWQLSATEIADRIRQRALSATEAAQAALQRLAAVNPAINAVVDHRPDEVLQRARAIDATLARGENPGALAGMVKLAYANRLQKVSGLAMELRGLDAIAPAEDDAAMREWQQDYIWSTAMRIAGGADEVLRNQIAERMLGMPGEMRVDKDIPFDKLR